MRKNSPLCNVAIRHKIQKCNSLWQVLKQDQSVYNPGTNQHLFITKSATEKDDYLKNNSKSALLCDIPIRHKINVCAIQ